MKNKALMKKIIIINSIAIFLFLIAYLLIKSNYLLFFISLYISLSLGIYAYWSIKLRYIKLCIYLILLNLPDIIAWIFLIKIL